MVTQILILIGGILLGSKSKFCVDIMAFNSKVTGSCNLCSVRFPDGDRVRFLVDCGMYQEVDTKGMNSTMEFKPETIDFVLVTHNHVDHIGRLPLLVKNGFSNPIYATNETANYLMRLALTDTLSVLTESAKVQGIQALYREEHVDKVLSLLKPVDFMTEIRPHKKIRVLFMRNGHTVGSAMILVQFVCHGCDGINLLFTGDYNNKNVFFDVPPLRKWITQLPITVIQESTYGTTDTQIDDVRFDDKISQVAQEGKNIVLLAYSFGRTQEVLYRLKRLQEQGKLSVDIPIYLDGKLGTKYTTVYPSLDIKEEMKDFLPENFVFPIGKDERMDVIQSKSQKIIVTSSGNGSYGPAQLYLPQFLPRNDTFIAYTGYTPVGTVGAAMKDAKTGSMVKTGGVVVTKQAEVEYFTEFSGHAKADALIEFLKQFEKLKLVLVNHGEPETKLEYAGRVEKEINVESVGVLDRDYFFRIDSNGLIRSIPAKLT